MDDTMPYAQLVLAAAGAGLLALLSSRISEHLRVPAPALFLVASAVAVRVVPALHMPPERTVERIVTVALLCILFDGGMHIGWSRLQPALAPIAWVGVLGTFLTAGAAGLFVHVVLGASWYIALLVGTAVAPTDPAVVFSVLGNREVSGRSGTILEGESGANDPVGIALMASLVTAGGLSADAAGSVAGEFVLQMGLGAALGFVLGRVLLLFMRHVPLPGAGLYPLRTLAGFLLIYGATTLAHGSGFLAVFVAGIVLGDAGAPYKREVENFHSALASLAEIVAFVVLGLTVDLGELTHPDVWLAGLALGTVLAVLVRPLLVGLCLLPSGLTSGERNFVLFAGLKGAVPILLGGFILTAGVPDAERWYGVVVVVVVLSVLAQGSFVPAVAARLHVPMRMVEPEPWAVGVRLRDEPTGAHRLTVEAGAPASGLRVRDLSDLPGQRWIGFIVRDGGLVPVRGTTRLETGDDVIVLGESDLPDAFEAAFRSPAARDDPPVGDPPAGY